MRKKTGVGKYAPTGQQERTPLEKVCLRGAWWHIGSRGTKLPSEEIPDAVRRFARDQIWNRTLDAWEAKRQLRRVIPRMTLIRESDFSGTTGVPGEGKARTFGGMSKEDINDMAGMKFKQMRNDGLTKKETNALFCMELQARHSKKRLLTLRPRKQPVRCARRKWESGTLIAKNNVSPQQKILKKHGADHTGCERNNDPCQ